MYAQTNIDLYNQLTAGGCPEDDLKLMRRAYELAVVLFSGLYRPSGKTFLDHVVGTASIAQAVSGKATLSAAGLLHSAYSHGDFGFAGRISAHARKRRLVDAVGSEVEAYVQMYTDLPWSMRDAPALVERIDDMTPGERDVVLLRVVNELEDHLDGATLYCYSAARHKDKLEQRREVLGALARRLAASALEQEIERVFAACANQPVVPELLPRRRTPRSHRVLPRSCRKSAWLFAYGIMRRALRWSE